MVVFQCVFVPRRAFRAREVKSEQKQVQSLADAPYSPE